MNVAGRGFESLDVRCSKNTIFAIGIEIGNQLHDCESDSDTDRAA
jgi:hypothetical protein